MLPRASLGRHAQRALRAQCCAQPSNRRSFASPASGSFAYQTGEAAGTKLASRDFAGPTTTLALVSKAGTRFEILPGLTEALEKSAFRGTTKRSPLRIIRESELLGAELFSYHSRENLVVGAKFLRDDLPYYVELLAEIASNTEYKTFRIKEEVMPLISLSQKMYLANTKAMAWDSVHGIAFHRGLGNTTNPASSTFTKYVDAEAVEYYSQIAYAKPNFALVANGADSSATSKWVGDFFSAVPAAPPSDAPKLESPQTKYYGGEERIAHGSGNSMVLGFTGSSSYTGGFYKPEIQVLASLLGGKSSIKWSPGFSLLSKATADFPSAHVDSKSAIYSDAGLLTVSIDGSARDVARAAFKVVESIKKVAAGDVSAEDVKKAVAQAKFKELEHGQNIWGSLELTGTGLIHDGKAYQLDETAKKIESVTVDQVKKAAATILETKASVSTVGDLYLLPFAEEIGLKV